MLKAKQKMSKSEWLQNVALLVLVYAIRMYKQTLFHNYEPEGPLPKYQCTPMLGFDKTDHYYATEDTEVNYELNLMAISIGFRENLFKGKFECGFRDFQSWQNQEYEFLA